MAAKDKELKLDSGLDMLPGVGPKKAASYAKIGIESIGDLLTHFPVSYEDHRKIYTVAELKDVPEGRKVQICARVISKVLGRGYGRNRSLRLTCEDNTGRIDILYFNAAFLASNYKQGEEYCFFGAVKCEKGRYTMFHPSSETVQEAEKCILPVYGTCRGLSQKDIRKGCTYALELLDEKSSQTDGFGAESLPVSVLEENNLCGMGFAFRNIHFPEDEQAYSQARFRLIFEEFFYLRMALMLSKDRFGKGRAGISFQGCGGDEFISSLSYKLTGAQAKVWEEVKKDMVNSRCMNRLVQGDVGSGKTVIAEAALAQAVKCGKQGVFMAPTEILAAQHYRSLTDDFKPFGTNIVLITGSMSAKERKAALSAVRDGSAEIIVGTHALISGDVVYHDLGLVITDEQHRFGVNQRKSIAEKGENPDVMVMTATPIPRTLAVVLYGDLDVSVIDELPPGRKTVITRKYTEKSRKDAYKLLIEQVRSGRQAYIVAPLISESEELDVRSAEDVYGEFSKKYPDVTCELLHGAMKQADKDRIMEAFQRGEISVLISTVVIEVGVNVPNACVMLLENSERFGLAQMHQLRGRVGRGSSQSYCLIVLGNENDISAERADTICSTSDGFIIAEKDLEMRGPGELFGYRQHGLPQLQLADPAKHIKVAEQAGKAAEKLLDEDKDLSRPENSQVLEYISKRFTDTQQLTL